MGICKKDDEEYDCKIINVFSILENNYNMRMIVIGGNLSFNELIFRRIVSDYLDFMLGKKS